MPQHASAKKRMKTSARSRARNRSVKSHIRRAVGEVQASLGEETAEEQLRRAQSVIDKSAKKGVLHSRAANRKKARLARAVHRAATAKK